jgi:hypothetical protein
MSRRRCSRPTSRSDRGETRRHLHFDLRIADALVVHRPFLSVPAIVVTSDPDDSHRLLDVNDRGGKVVFWRILDRYADAMMAVGTRLEGELLTVAQELMPQPRSRVGNVDDLAKQNRAVIVTVLCAAAALEAFINQEEFDRNQAWWKFNERLSLDEKWEQLLVLLTGTAPSRASGWFQGLVRLYENRNLVAHYKGIRRGKEMTFAGPQRTTWGNISGTRAYLDANLALASVGAAREAIRQFYSLVKEQLPAFLPEWVRQP